MSSNLFQPAARMYSKVRMSRPKGLWVKAISKGKKPESLSKKLIEQNKTRPPLRSWDNDLYLVVYIHVRHESPVHPRVSTVPPPILVVIDALQVAVCSVPSCRYPACPVKPKRWHRSKLPLRFLCTISSTRPQTLSIPDPPYLDDTTTTNTSR